MATKKEAKTAPSFPHKGCGHRGAKKARHERKGSATAGSTKPTCKATWQHKWVCRGARAYKHPDYLSVFRSLDKKAGNRRAFV